MLHVTVDAVCLVYVIPSDEEFHVHRDRYDLVYRFIFMLNTGHHM